MIDHSYLDSLVELLGKDTINEIRLVYVNESAEKLEDLFAAWEAKNFTELQDISHSLKSSSLSMAMADFAEQCRMIEELSQTADEQGIKPITENLSVVYHKSLEELVAYFED
ncbi:Hpt domain-containing protein [Marinomonas sp. 2405UD66-6]|uniref:Hpt domain-containing protein n=1 Tax=Marinomonas sp. 2405UD66-6 TaxID=3391834 RepID=UPI0039C9A69A